MDKNEVADYLGCTPRTVNRYVKQGKLKIVYINREAIFDPSEVEELKREQLTPVHRSIVVSDEIETRNQREDILLQMTTHLLAEVKKISLQQSRLTHIEDLERCCDRGWLLRSHELKELVRLKRLPRSPFSRYGFIFQRQGRWWNVKKND